MFGVPGDFNLGKSNSSLPLNVDLTTCHHFRLPGKHQVLSYDWLKHSYFNATKDIVDDHPDIKWVGNWCVPL